MKNVEKNNSNGVFVQPALRQVKHSFTLIELLVVIAIIAILAAMLLPALQSARKRGISASCQSQLKQLGVVIMAYADAFDGWGATGTDWGNTAQWSVAYAPFMPGSKNNITTSSKYPYFSIMRCPGYKVMPASNYPGYSGASYVYSSYALFFGIGTRKANETGCWWGWNLKTMSQFSSKTYHRQVPRVNMLGTIQTGRPGETYAAQKVQLHSPAKQMVIADRNDVTGKISNAGQPSHWPGINLAFADGHVEGGLARESSAQNVALNYYDEIYW